MRTIADCKVKDLYKFKRNKLGLYQGPGKFKLLNWSPLAFNLNVKIIEVEPRVRTFRWRYGTLEKTYTWAHPFLQFTQIDNGPGRSDNYLGVTATKKPWKFGNQIYPTPFPNVYDNMMICQDPATSIEDGITIFFSSYFENPFHWPGPYVWNQAVFKVFCQDFCKKEADWSIRFSEVWEKMTQEDPFFMLKISWKSLLWQSGLTDGVKRTTIMEFLNTFCRDEIIGKT